MLGDDVILQHSGHVPVKEMSSYLSNFGLQLHDEQKTVVGEVHFLGAFWNKGKPDLNVEELVQKAVFPEKFRKYGEKPHRGAEAVLRSYASSYLSGFRLLPEARLTDFEKLDRPRMDERLVTDWLSGSEKFFEEEYAAFRSKSYEPCLSTRILL